MLVIEYVMEGHQRGYNFTTPTAGYDEATLKTIWRQAMARGQGWGAPVYTGARAIKSFPLPDGQFAVSEVIVTDLEDEGGRRGIRRAEIEVMPPRLYALHLESRLAGYPADIRAEAARKAVICSQRANRLKKDMPLVITAPYTTPRAWWLVEALILTLAVTPRGALQRWGVVPFTTLALDYRGESRMVALPEERTNVVDMPITCAI
ncbi:MAG: hypothetical protein OHK0046_14570 [Anaerolineae bacterium]